MNFTAVVNKLKRHSPNILGIENYTKFAILIPLLQKQDGVHVLFEVRAQGLRRQPGEICFPGGKMDGTDTSEMHSAIRETIEELRITEKDLSNVLPLDYMVSPFGTIIYPFVGLLSSDAVLDPNPDEVKEVFTVPLSFFEQTMPECYRVGYQIVPETGFPFHLIAGGENYNWQTRKMDEFFYMYYGKVIWGLTARIIRHLIEILEKKG